MVFSDYGRMPCTKNAPPQLIKRKKEGEWLSLFCRSAENV